MKNLKHASNQQGFTLIELIMVIVLLGILSAFAIPKFADLSDNAKIGTHTAVASAFESGLNIARMKYISLNQSSTGPLEDVQIYSTPGRYGTLDFNANGWPSQSYNGPLESNPQVNNAGDCRSIFLANMEENTISIGTNNQFDYQANYLGSARCEYYNSQTNQLTFIYDSNNGEVTVDDVI